jgi:hypothetical protein
MDENECYLRCYGWVGEEGDVRVLPARGNEPVATAVLTERIRLAFEARLDGRDDELQAA